MCRGEKLYFGFGCLVAEAINVVLQMRHFSC
ncbi:MAG: hypothetical protein GPOALKHO_001151 [Sodalis sp.]|nr:MAG: hypothetical protein GPOALKHO_001151 [Sodalis sp.]